MNHWAFVIAAYGAALLATAGLLLWAFAGMRLAESEAERMKRDR